MEVGLFDERLGYSYSRRRSMIGGEDSLLAQRIRKANYPIYYQPAARAWHKISKTKLTKRYFLKRNYWDGVTLMAVLYLSGSITRRDSWPIIIWHAREVLRHIRNFLFPMIKPGDGTTRSRARMQALSQCANSAGVISSALRLRVKGELP